MSIVQEILKTLVNIFFSIFFSIFPKRKISKNLQDAIDLYKSDGFGEKFAEIRAWDAPYEPLDKLIRKKSTVLDLGCGDGLLSNFLAISSKQRKIYGIDINKNRIKIAYKGLKNTKFQEGDILKAKTIKPDTIILAHVLHHLPNKGEQIKLLTRISKDFKRGNELLILEIDKKPVLKYIFTYLTDAFTVPIIFEKKLFDFNFYYRKSSEWKNILESLGFNVEMKKINKGMPFSHVLIYAKKLS